MDRHEWFKLPMHEVYSIEATILSCNNQALSAAEDMTKTGIGSEHSYRKFKYGKFEYWKEQTRKDSELGKVALDEGVGPTIEQQDKNPVPGVDSVGTV